MTVSFIVALWPSLTAYPQEAPQDQKLPKGVIGEISLTSRATLRCIAVSPDGRMLAAGAGGLVELWDLEKAKTVRTLGTAEGRPLGRLYDHSGIDAVLFLPEGKRILAGGRGVGFALWDVETGALLWHEPGLGGVLALSPDGRTLAAVNGYRGVIALWDIADHKEIGTITGHKLLVWSVAFSPDGKSLVSGSADLTVRKWDLASRKELWRLGVEATEFSIGPSFPEHIRYSADGRHLAVSYHGCWFLKLALVDSELGRELSEVPIDSSDALDFHPKDSVVAFHGEGHRLHLWDVEKKRLKARSPESNADWWRDISFTPDGKRLITIRNDGIILLWDVSQFELSPGSIPPK